MYVLLYYFDEDDMLIFFRGKGNFIFIWNLFIGMKFKVFIVLYVDCINRMVNFRFNILWGYNMGFGVWGKVKVLKVFLNL